MRTPALALLAFLAGLGPVAAEPAPADLAALEQAWHACLREAYLQQPADQTRPGRERQALDRCKGQEDAYVAALMLARADGAERQVLAWAQTWATSITAYVVDPVAAWIASLRR